MFLSVITYPRPNRRGLIEARGICTMDVSKRLPTRGPTAAASLKLQADGADGHMQPLYPRPNRRGLIEAEAEPVHPQALPAAPYPRPNRRGLIEAGDAPQAQLAPNVLPAAQPPRPH